MQSGSFAAVHAALQSFPSMPSQRSVDTTEYVQQCMEYLGNPQDSVPAIHIAGTSGKTSTAYYAAALLQAAGLKVGLLTSPHVWLVRERVQVNLEPLPETLFSRELETFIALVRRSGAPLTRSEVLYMFAYWQFAKQGVDYMVIETGRGGLLDATNVLSRPDKVCIITDIGIDHAHILGNTLARIAEHKAGIIGLHNSVFCYRQDESVMGVLAARARHKLADMHIYDVSAEEVLPPTLPVVQHRNAGLALYAVRHILQRLGRPALGTGQIRAALQVYIPGRLEVREIEGKRVIIDGAHNPQKLQMFLNSVAARFPGQPMAAVVAFTQGRDLADMVAVLGPVEYLIATTFPAAGPNARASCPAGDIVAACQSRKASSYVSLPHPVAAFRELLARPEPVKLVTGSFRLLPQVLPASQTDASLSL